MTTYEPVHYGEREQATIARVREELESGRTFALREMSARSSYGYEPPINRTQWAMAMKQVAEMAAQSDALAQVARRISINLYGTDSQAQAAVWQAIGEAMRAPYDDVIGRSGPEGMSPAQSKRPYTLAERLQVLAWGERIATPFASHVPGIGWAAQAIAREERVRLPEMV